MQAIPRLVRVKIQLALSTIVTQADKRYRHSGGNDAQRDPSTLFSAVIAGVICIIRRSTGPGRGFEDVAAGKFRVQESVTSCRARLDFAL